MNKMVSLFDEYVVKAISLSENMTTLEANQGEIINLLADNRDRLLHIIEKISHQIDWEEVENSIKIELNNKVELLKEIDTKLLLHLESLRNEISQSLNETKRSKQNVKSYNLSSTK